jgi:hypothetical protein
LSCFHNFLSPCSEDEEPPADATTAPLASPAATDEPVEPAAAVRATRSAVKKVSQTQARNAKRAKKAKETNVSLEAHTPMVSSDEVSNSSLACFLCIYSFSDTRFSSDFDEEICHLGHRMRRVPKGCESFRRYDFVISKHYFVPLLCLLLST